MARSKQTARSSTGGRPSAAAIQAALQAELSFRSSLAAPEIVVNRSAPRAARTAPLTHRHRPTMQLRDNKRARMLPDSTLDTLDNDLLIRCASYLDADGLVQLGRTSARFGIPQPGQQRSLVNEAGRQQFLQSSTDEEWLCLPIHDDESDIGLCRALEQLRRHLRFDELVGNGFVSQEHPASVTHTGRDSWSTAMSGHVMRGGRHFTEFTITNEQSRPVIWPGIMRPVLLTMGVDFEADWNRNVNPVQVSSHYKPAVAEKLRSKRTAKWGGSNVHCCAYNCETGQCYWSDWNTRAKPIWREGLGESDTIGLLLDLDEGTLSLFKSGRFLGVMKDGLGGEYAWFVSVFGACTISMSKGSAPSE